MSDWRETRAILRKIAETNTCVELLTAVTLGDILLVRLLVESNADICDATVLIEAVEKGHTEIVRLLLDHDFPLANTALRIAVKKDTRILFVCFLTCHSNTELILLKVVMMIHR